MNKSKKDGWKVPVYNWTGNDLDEKTTEQIDNLARLPFAAHHVALMPDAHAGYGMPIGGVLFTDNVIVPYAIGVDIGCGVQIAKTDLIWEDSFGPKELSEVLHQIQRDVPTGFSARNREPWSITTTYDEIDTRRKAIDFVEGSITYTPALRGWLDKVQTSIGTLGGGNHFLELQRDDENRIYFMLHSGSRNLGQQICKHYHKIALELNKQWYSALPDPELAYLPKGTEQFHGYFSAMEVGLLWAEVNRTHMMYYVEYAFERHTKMASFEVLADVHHNFAAYENHYGQNGIVHRKGSVRAREGETVLIPGSMGTGSYIGVGTGNPESFQSCQHGAGRAIGRNEMRRQMTSAELNTEMESLGVKLVSNAKGEAVVEEAPRAYKDIESVMQNSADLVTPTVKLYPLGVVKG